MPKGVHNMGRLVAEAEAADLPRRPDAAGICWSGSSPTRKRALTPSPPICAAPPRRTRPRDGLQTMPGSDRSRQRACRHAAGCVGLPLGARLVGLAGADAKAHSSGGKERLGTISKMGNRYVRRLLYLGAMGVISTRKRTDPGDDWLGRMLAKKPLKVVAIALANRMARAVWAMLRTGEVWRQA